MKDLPNEIVIGYDLKNGISNDGQYLGVIIDGDMNNKKQHYLVTVDAMQNGKQINSNVQDTNPREVYELIDYNNNTSMGTFRINTDKEILKKVGYKIATIEDCF